MASLLVILTNKVIIYSQWDLNIYKKRGQILFKIELPININELHQI